MHETTRSRGGEAGSAEVRTAEAPRPPIAERRPHRLEAHGEARLDPYYWLRRRDDPDVIAHLEAENRYTEAVMAPQANLVDALYEEIVGRIPQQEISAPVVEDGWAYYERYDEGLEYPIHCRRSVGETERVPTARDDCEQVLIDENELAEGHDFFSLRGPVMSPDHRIAAFATDTVGRRVYTLRFKDVESGEMLPDAVPEVTGNLVWAADSRTVFYSKQHPQTLRWYQIWRHRLGTDAADDVLVYEESDETFSTYVFGFDSEAFVAIGCSQTLADEYRILPADDPTGEWRLFEPRRRGHEYSIDHAGDTFYVRTNDGAENFRLMATPEDATGREHWRQVVPHRDDVFLEGFEVFDHFLVLEERQRGLIRLRTLRRDPAGGGWPALGAGEVVDFGQPAYDAALWANPEDDTAVVRYHFESLSTPASVYAHDLSTGERTLIWRQEVAGAFEADDYEVERLEAPARDGARIPISLVYRRHALTRTPSGSPAGENPLLLSGYGSYGITVDAGFRSSIVSLLDRGFVFAIAHVRGGQALGRRWYEEGKLMAKQNTFTDFIDAAAHLVATGHADPTRLFAIGGSAGGLLVGAVANMRPDLWTGIVARVPFVDVVTTMLDDSIPLTTGEYDEWGDPNDPDAYRYIRSYSPYDNVEAKDYPHLFVTAGLHDSQVQYWEPAKWVAKLRATRTDDDLTLLRTEMGAGHGGASGRFRQHRETAVIYAFLLRLANLAEDA